jgi:hypothetical protein
VKTAATFGVILFYAWRKLSVAALPVAAACGTRNQLRHLAEGTAIDSRTSLNTITSTTYVSRTGRAVISANSHRPGLRVEDGSDDQLQPARMAVLVRQGKQPVSRREHPLQQLLGQAALDIVPQRLPLIPIFSAVPEKVPTRAPEKTKSG